MDILTVNDAPGVYADSYYTSSVLDTQPYAQASGELRYDVCVIGGGYTGLSSALHLAQKGYKVVVLEANRVGWGASGRNGGQVCSGQRQPQDVLEKMVGHERAHLLWDLSLKATEAVETLIQTHGIQCDYTSGIIHADHRERFVAHSHQYAEKLEKEYNYTKMTALDKAQIRQAIASEDYYGGVLDRGSAHLHPLKFALGLADAARAAGVHIHENTRVLSLDESQPAVVRTEQATVTADFVVLACNGYLGKLNTTVASRVMPINNYMVATEPMSEEQANSLIANNVAVADSRFVVNYYRFSADKRLLFGGGESYGYRFPRDIPAIVRKPLQQIFPQLASVRFDYAWGGTLGITMNRMPNFTRVAGHILSASGYSGHGLAYATLSGAIMADAIDGQASSFDLMANVPKLPFPGGTLLRTPLLALGMTWYALRDRF